ERRDALERGDQALAAAEARGVEGEEQCGVHGAPRATCTPPAVTRDHRARRRRVSSMGDSELRRVLRGGRGASTRSGRVKSCSVPLAPRGQASATVGRGSARATSTPRKNGCGTSVQATLGTGTTFAGPFHRKSRRSSGPPGGCVQTSVESG